MLLSILAIRFLIIVHGSLCFTDRSIIKNHNNFVLLSLLDNCTIISYFTNFDSMVYFCKVVVTFVISTLSLSQISCDRGVSIPSLFVA
jgi:hypothetical protein